jgi:hypothetical protein
MIAFLLKIIKQPYFTQIALDLGLFCDTALTHGFKQTHARSHRDIQARLTEPAIGMFTSSSQCSRVKRRIPSPSAPITQAIGPATCD